MVSRRVPGELSPGPSARDGACHDLHEEVEQQWWETEQAGAATSSKAFPGFQSRQGNEHFEKLYADSEARMTKLSRMQDDALREKVEKERNFMKAPRRGSKEDLADACNRLYGEATSRRQRQVKKKEEQAYLEDLHEALKVGNRSRSTPSLVRDGESRWDRLYASGLEKERKLAREREKKIETEMQYLQNHSVHSRGEAQGLEAFNRLYNDGIQREWRREQKKLLDAESEQCELDKVSVHRPGDSTLVEDAADRLYKEGKLRLQRQAAQRKVHTENERVAGKTASADHIAKRVNLLYKDAERRTLDRKWIQGEFEKEQLETMLRQSVHASVRENASDQVERIFDRVAYQQEPKSMRLADPPRSARTPPPRRRPDSTPAQARPATARRNVPGELDVNPELNRPRAERSVTPTPRQAAKSPRNAGPTAGPGKRPVTPRQARLVGGSSLAGDAKPCRRGSGRDGPAPFAQMPSALEREEMARKKRGFNAAAPKSEPRRTTGPFMMTHLVEEGARQALSAELPSP